MHPNPTFRKAERTKNLNFARETGFGVLLLNGDGGPLVSHIPFVLDASGEVLGAHLVRSNPIARHLAEGDADGVMIVSGPHGYISPDWYGQDDQVPTWNYVAVHLRGPIKLLDQEALTSHLEGLSAFNEARLAPKPAWTMDKNEPETLIKMQRMIVPIEMTVEDVQGTWKLNQNKDEDVRLAAADAVSDAELASLMRDPPL